MLRIKDLSRKIIEYQKGIEQLPGFKRYWTDGFWRGLKGEDNPQITADFHDAVDLLARYHLTAIELVGSAVLVSENIVNKLAGSPTDNLETLLEITGVIGIAEAAKYIIHRSAQYFKHDTLNNNDIQVKLQQ